MDSAIRDIEEHPKGKLFRRLIEYGPHDPNDPEAITSDGETTLSDRECGVCVEFIYSHMVNRFKGELAELLAIEPCIRHVKQLQQNGVLPGNIHLNWGETIQERHIVHKENYDLKWGGFTKGADGLIGELTDSCCCIFGVIEIKSMKCGKKRVLQQIDRHIARLSGGVKLGTQEYAPHATTMSDSNLLKIMVVPAGWKLSREWYSEKTDKGSSIVLADPEGKPTDYKFEELEPRLWKITLQWSQEALEQAAYEMTFWYMSQVGKHIYTGREMPKGWEHMSPEEAGYNAIKMMLYYIPLRFISSRLKQLAIKLYNVYCFSYPLGIDSKEMLWPQDFPNKY
ncbi:MAG: hypothetical protein HQL08_08845 [Nitrospirae bacterium]|nr:hypothetical protein [Nitrospirota bacterium]